MRQLKAPQQSMIMRHYMQKKNKRGCRFQFLNPKKDQEGAPQEADTQSH